MCLQSCAFAHIISPTFWWLRHGFLNSRSALLPAYCILYRKHHWKHQQRWNARYSHRVSHICDIWRRWSENTSQIIPFSLKTTSIITENLISPLKCLIGSCTDLNVDSGSCSGLNLKYWLRQKIQTPAGVHPGSVIISCVGREACAADCVGIASVWAWTRKPRWRWFGSCWRRQCARRFGKKEFLLHMHESHFKVSPSYSFPFSLRRPSLLACSGRASARAYARGFWGWNPLELDILQKRYYFRKGE